MNWHDSGRFCTESLESAAKRYKTLGFSIIPLQGARNPQQPKLPAIRWARYQHTIATDDEVHDWFGAEPLAGIGIVCGRVSRLMVMDFDDASEASEFRHLFPDLVQTLIVRSGTRGLPHFYYRLPVNKVVPTSAHQGVDVRGEGSYVVAPPTRIGNMAWIVECDGPIREVTEFDLRRIMGFLTTCKPASETTLNRHRSAIHQPEASEFRHIATGDELVRFYRERCCRGRNQALFQTAVVARDMGIAETAFVVMLAGIHATEAGTNYEPYGVRYAEAIRTIASAYSRPAYYRQLAACGLSNGVREWLLGKGLANVARVVDGLYVVGMKSDELFTEAQACQRLAKLKIGRRSIMAVLKCVINGFVVFGGGNTPPNPPINAKAAEVAENLTHSCEMSRGAKRVINQMKGRPARLYRLPSPDEIAKNLGVSGQSGDVVTDSDFKSAKTYRAALHAKLLERRPGYYARGWLAARLGVSRWTARRYEKASGIVVQPSYSDDRLTWSCARRLPDMRTGFTRGVFIETRDGQRYPAVRGLALKLLKCGQDAVLKQQLGNFYAAKFVSVGIPTPQTMSARHEPRVLAGKSSKLLNFEKELCVGIPTLQEAVDGHIACAKADAISTNATEVHSSQNSVSVGIPTPQEPKLVFWICPDCLNWHVMEREPELCMQCGAIGRWETLSPMIWRNADALKAWWQERYRDYQNTKRQHVGGATWYEQKHLTEDKQSLAEQLHRQVPDLSLKNAQRLVGQFSNRLIEKAIGVIRTRGGLRNPAGFLITFLKSESKLFAEHNKMAAVKPKTESALDWLKRLAKSEYLNFISNAEDILNGSGFHEFAPACS